jgi:threonine/homoserine/homoserine lactone efflux protein
MFAPEGFSPSGFSCSGPNTLIVSQQGCLNGKQQSPPLGLGLTACGFSYPCLTMINLKTLTEKFQKETIPEL